MEKKKTSAGCLPGKPCFPWVGGKRRLLPVLIQSLPENITEMETYVEPFVGGGALFFWLRQTYPHIRCVINDSNESLVNVYRVIRDTPEELVGLLAGIQGEYHTLEERTERRDYFMEKRRVFNEEHPDDITRAALFIFFMRTCYNGIYSVNRKGRLSVTFGTGSRTRILEEELIRCNHKLLQDVIILDGDYRQTEKYAGEKSFFYFDPPYKPVNEAGACTSYMPDDFDDDCQIELAGFCRDLGEKGSK